MTLPAPERTFPIGTRAWFWGLARVPNPYALVSGQGYSLWRPTYRWAVRAANHRNRKWNFRVRSARLAVRSADVTGANDE